MYENYSSLKIITRRIAVIVIGLLALPIMLLRDDRARFYSYLHRVWCKTSQKPVWLAQAEAAGRDIW
ncbi:hypothetical protein J9874_02284 [Duffyella gerundensis]|jgi:hypothetical protein|uniref:Putative membrane protein n=1 Tax=Duffyella gerundensis TaxID=1619313 RepID=A0A0U5L3J7_9GAMM|nr:YbfA family protein [Duffyella gerundensis]QTO53273.1 YbfA family protein [Duffyella gerundensis]UCB31740.1 hypothetical protein J9874_02284 [Duffyella gerundensis]CUU23334.1 putative membrane protein [Duffyella gerundensis]